MASPIATLFARLGFDVDEKGLKRFEGQLKTLKNDINSMGVVQQRVGKEAVQSTNKQTRAISQQAKATGNLSQNIKDVVAGYGRVPKTLQDARRDMDKLNKIQSRGGLTAIDSEELVKGRARVQNKIDQISAASEKKRLSFLERIEKSYDKSGKQLRDLRRDYSFVNDQYRQGNMSVRQRNKLLQQQYEKYRQIQAVQRRSALDRGAGGIFAGGEDPRQVGNHRLISALHSDVGLGSMVAAFGAVQSSLAYQNFVAMEQGLTAVTGSAEEAGKQFEYLHSVSNKLGVNIQNLGSAYTQFAAAMRGSDLQTGEMQETFEGFVSYARVLNLSAADMDGVFRSVIQMANKGQIMAINNSLVI